MVLSWLAISELLPGLGHGSGLVDVGQVAAGIQLLNPIPQ